MDVSTNTASAPAPATSTANTDSDTADMLALAQKADAGEPIDSQQSSPAQDNTTDAAPAEAESANSEGDQQQQAQPEGAKPAATKPNAKAETPYQKAKAEAERRDRSWKALNEEKERFRQERAKVDEEITKLRNELQAIKAPKAPVTDEAGHTAETYDRLAKKYEDAGETEKAQLAKEQAAKLRARAPSEQPSQQPNVEVHTTPEFKSKWQANVQELIQAEPTLSDPQNPIVVGANALIGDPNYGRFFKAHPDGIKAAVMVAKMQAKAAQADIHAKTIETQKAEIARLTRLLNPRGSPPAGQAPATKPEDMSDDDMLAKAAAADRGA